MPTHGGNERRENVKVAEGTPPQRTVDVATTLPKPMWVSTLGNKVRARRFWGFEEKPTQAEASERTLSQNERNEPFHADLSTKRKQLSAAIHEM